MAIASVSQSVSGRLLFKNARHKQPFTHLMQDAKEDFAKFAVKPTIQVNGMTDWGHQIPR
jgi:hypothetical protein